MALNVSLGLKTSLQQTLTPQQIQYLKLLQMPLVQFEQELMREIEENPLLTEAEETESFDSEPDLTDLTPENPLDAIFEQDRIRNESPEFSDILSDASPEEIPEGSPDYYSDSDDLYFDDLKVKNEYSLSNLPPTDFDDPFDFYSAVIGDSESPATGYSIDEDSEQAEYQIRDNIHFLDELEKQLALYIDSEEHHILGKHIIWNVDDDGYLRRELQDLVNETNLQIREINFDRHKTDFEKNSDLKEELSRSNPAYNHSLDESSKKILGEILMDNPELIDNERTKFVRSSLESRERYLDEVSLKDAEKVLGIIQKLDPPGIASRNIRECLLAQAKAIANDSPARVAAITLLEVAFEEFSKKHFKDVMKITRLGEEELKDAIDFIKKLNPKPGEGYSFSEMNTVIPDFIVEKDTDSSDLIISLNDSSLPPLKISRLYESMKKDAKEQKYNKETKQWIRSKYEDAKFIIQAVQQRKVTMLKIMSAIAGQQKDFFDYGREFIKPMVYKDIADIADLDISTVCRIVNNKYVRTEFGTFELKYFFSEALPTDDGEEISTTVIKQKIKELIDSEDKNKPLSDDQLAKDLKNEGFNIARRTIAKYREQMRIPVARLRKEL